MIKILVVALLASALMSGCAQVPINKVTQSGKPERLFKSAKASDIKSSLIDGCSAAGLQVDDRGQSTLICSKRVTGSEAVFAQMIVGNSYSTTPERKVSFVITQRGGDVFVISTDYWYETQMAFGQIRRQDIYGNQQINEIQYFLDGVRIR